METKDARNYLKKGQTVIVQITGPSKKGDARIGNIIQGPAQGLKCIVFFAHKKDILITAVITRVQTNICFAQKVIDKWKSF